MRSESGGRISFGFGERYDPPVREEGADESTLPIGPRRHAVDLAGSGGAGGTGGPEENVRQSIGLTETDALRVVIAPTNLRIQGPASLCQANVTVEFLDATNLTVLASEGPILVSIGSSLEVDFSADVGAAPARKEVLVRATVDRAPGRSAEEGTLGGICPLSASLQMYDILTGRTVVYVGFEPAPGGGVYVPN